MVARKASIPANGGLRLAVQLHDASAGLAVGIGLLKGWTESEAYERMPDSHRAIEVFEEVLAELRQLSRTVSAGAGVRPRATNVRESLERDARTGGVELELKVIGDEEWLTEDQLDLVRLVGREAIRNVKRHSGARRCRLTVDVSTCPFVLTARDWGAGLQPGPQRRGGITLLEDLARRMGAGLGISSQPGLGMELTLTGPGCIRTRGVQHTDGFEDRLRSVVAGQSLGSRKRVASRRPIEGSEQQIK